MAGTELLEALKDCGSKLPESHKPAPVDVYELIAGLLYWLETGSTIPPEPAAPEPSRQTAQEAEIERLKAQLASAESQIPAKDLPASPVAPAAPQPSDTALETVEPAVPVSDVPSEPA